jgi:hypothetical protein
LAPIGRRFECDGIHAASLREMTGPVVLLVECRGRSRICVIESKTWPTGRPDRDRDRRWSVSKCSASLRQRPPPSAPRGTMPAAGTAALMRIFPLIVDPLAARERAPDPPCHRWWRRADRAESASRARTCAGSSRSRRESDGAAFVPPLRSHYHPLRTPRPRHARRQLAVAKDAGFPVSPGTRHDHQDPPCPAASSPRRIATSPAPEAEAHPAGGAGDRHSEIEGCIGERPGRREARQRQPTGRAARGHRHRQESRALARPPGSTASCPG